MISTCRQTLLAALDQHPTVNIRESLAKSLGGTATKSEVAVAQRAARAIAEEGRAVLMTLYNHQAKGVECRTRESRAVLHLTVDEDVVLGLPYRVTIATGKWGDVVEEGKRRTNERIDNDPMLSWMMGRGPYPLASSNPFRRAAETR
ncbi:hypothetical protein OEIGOIKO_05734 [Streptomyces chrestomyceticus JCM 4735]|uniref:Uncharacterized protein n=2 Tax=Streptomyces chrestomyceticus TaxID=68185 RepID=A0A7U9KYT9_9ACTN|nr:hypothetical protein OEIGOIKO_05734 [Streptomyces chrestomyceticus JCM 4735]